MNDLSYPERVRTHTIPEFCILLISRISFSFLLSRLLFTLILSLSYTYTQSFTLFLLPPPFPMCHEQELCAKCICNLTCSVESHAILIQHNILQIIIMIALLRAVAPSTKLLCARYVPYCVV